MFGEKKALYLVIHLFSIFLADARVLWVYDCLLDTYFLCLKIKKVDGFRLSTAVLQVPIYLVTLNCQLFWVT